MHEPCEGGLLTSEMLVLDCYQGQGTHSRDKCETKVWAGKVEEEARFLLEREAEGASVQVKINSPNS